MLVSVGNVRSLISVRSPLNAALKRNSVLKVVRTVKDLSQQTVTMVVLMTTTNINANAKTRISPTSGDLRVKVKNNANSISK